MYNLEMVLYLNSCIIALDYIMREREVIVKSSISKTIVKTVKKKENGPKFD